MGVTFNLVFFIVAGGNGRYNTPDRIGLRQMTESELLSTLPLAAAVGYTMLLVALFLRRSPQEIALRWTLAFLCASITWAFLIFFAPISGLSANLPMKALLVGTMFLGMATAVFVSWPNQERFLIPAGLAILATILVDLFVPNQIFRPFPASTWAAFTVSSVISFLTWFALGSIIWLRTWRDFRRTAFPWHANRLLFWLVALLIVFSGEAMIFLRFTGLTIAGQIVRFVGAVGLVYAISSHRLFDVRAQIRRSAVYLLVFLLTALPLTALIVFVLRLTQDRLSTTVVATAVAIIASFLLYQPLYGRVETLTYRYLFGESFNPGQVVRDYGRATSQVLDVEQLSQVVLRILSEKFQARRGALLLLKSDDEPLGLEPVLQVVGDGITETFVGLVTWQNGVEATAVDSSAAEDNTKEIEIEPIPGLGDLPRETISLAKEHPLIKTLVAERQPLLQYELDFNPAHRSVMAGPVGDWLKRMSMEAYVPITDGDQLKGIIALGPKQSGAPYQPGELSLMQILADQTVVALQNARIYTAQKAQNRHVRQLNEELKRQNERITVLDQVKTDFITIASHELRTPLTQVKGYADILEAMNESNSLNQAQTREIAGHINRATLRLESLITAMLDASQIDAAKMQLTYMETRIDTVIRLASEPLQTALRDRRIALRVDNLGTLPPIYADFKRLVQTFTNLLGNAVKYTPDQGSILVNGRLIPGSNGLEDYLEIMVADSGIGIDRRFHELIFEKFFRVGDPQLHSSGSTKFKGAGPGLGLTIAKGVIEAHGGRIWVESDGEDELLCPGSRFFILLPLRIGLAKQQKEKAVGERPSWLIG